MSILFILIIISLLLASGFLFAFFWATKSGQFEDAYTPSVRMLFDDEPLIEGNNDDLNPSQEELENKNKAIEN